MKKPMKTHNSLPAKAIIYRIVPEGGSSLEEIHTALDRYDVEPKTTEIEIASPLWEEIQERHLHIASRATAVICRPATHQPCNG